MRYHQIYSFILCIFFATILPGCYGNQKQIITKPSYQDDGAQDATQDATQDSRRETTYSLSRPKEPTHREEGNIPKPQVQSSPKKRFRNALNVAYIHNTTGIRFPARFGSFYYDSHQELEAQMKGYGTSVQYRSPNSHLTFYVYNYGLSKIPEGINNDLAKAAYKKALQEIMLASQAGVYTKVTDLTNMAIGIKVDAQQFFSAFMSTFTIHLGSVKKESMLALTTYNNHFFKLRLTRRAAPSKNSDPRDALEAMAMMLSQKQTVY